jgi:hypothetical protein
MNTYQDEDHEDEDYCINTKELRWECLCYECNPEIFRFKFLCIGCDDIGDVISTLEGTLNYFKKLKDEGYTVDGPIVDDYMYIVPPTKIGYFPIRGKDGELEYHKKSN